MALFNNNRNQRGTGFTNLNRVLDANKGNKLGNTVTSNVQGQANDVRSNVQKTQQQFNEEANKNRLDTQESKDKRDNVLGRFGDNHSQQSLAGTTEVANQVASNPAQAPAPAPTQPAQQSPQVTIVQPQAQPIVSDQEIQDFTKYRTGTYTGPTQLNDYQTLLGKASEAQQVGDLTRSTGGRQELLRRFVGGNDYSQGQQRLDTMLLGQQNQGELNQARKATRGLEQSTNEANNLAGAQAQEYVNRAKIFGEETVGKLNETRNPISGKVDARLAELQKEEDDRLAYHKRLSDSMLGVSEDTKGLDRITRLGLSLQSAKDNGYITDDQVQKLLGDGGLISRAESLGLDTNALINERLTNQNAKNLNRGGAANSYQEQQLNTLDRLLGKVGVDTEFNQAGADYEKGNLGFNLDSLNEYIGKSEKEKYGNDAKKMAELEAYNQRYLNQAIANSQGAIQNAANAGGALMSNLADPNSYYDPGKMGQNANQFVQGAGGAGVNAINAKSQGQNAFLEGITKLNIGGNSLANTEGGRQLLKAIELKSKMENEAAAASGKVLNSAGTGVQDLLSGNMKGAFNNLSGLNLAKDLGGSLAKNVSKSVSNAVSNITGGGIKISDEDLKTDINYGEDSQKNIEEFLSNLKPATYKYKDEVKDSPFASKDKQLGVMAQDLEKSEMGKESVIDTEAGKMVDYDDLQPKMLAALASLNEKVKKLEGKKKK